jgi:outer membrane protein TolC
MKNKLIWPLGLLYLLFCASLSLVAQSTSASETLSLEQAVKIALQNNSLLKASELGVEAAQANVRFEASAYLPKLSFDHTFTRGNNPVYVFGSLLTQRRFTQENFALDRLNVPPPLSNFQNRFSATQYVYDFGKISSRVAQSRVSSRLSEKELDATRSDLIFRVVKAYYEALLAREMVQVAETAVSSARAAEDSARARLQAGVALESDLLSVQVHRAGQEEELLKASTVERLARSALCFELGVPLERQFILVQQVAPLSGGATDLSTLQNAALQNRPDYGQTELALQQQELGVKAARSEFFPTVSLFGSWETDDQSFASRAGNNWLAGMNIHFNLFDGRASAARLAESRLQQSRALAMRDRLGQAIRLQVQKAFLDLETAGQRITVSQEAVKQAEESVRIIRNRYDAGLATVTDLLRAETAVSAAKGNHLRAVFDQRIGAANLDLQVGRLSPESRVIQE